MEVRGLVVLDKDARPESLARGGTGGTTLPDVLESADQSAGPLAAGGVPTRGLVVDDTDDVRSGTGGGGRFGLKLALDERLDTGAAGGDTVP